MCIRDRSTIEVIDKYYNATWHKILYEGQIGYFWDNNIKFNSGKPKVQATGTCTGTDVNIRVGASTSTGIYGKMVKNSKVEVLLKNYKTGWHQIWYDGRVAYISTGYVKF